MSDQTYALAQNGVYGQSNGVYTNALNAIPDTSMFQNPIYQWWAGSGIGVSDGQEASSWDDDLATITASSVGDPLYRADQAGFEAVEYDGVDDGHNWTSDSQLPTGSDPVSVAALVYLKSTAEQTFASWGTGNFNGDALTFGINTSDEVACSIAGTGSAVGGSPSTGTWITVGGQHDGSTVRALLNGSSVGTGSASPAINDDNHSLGWRRWYNDNYSDAYIAEVIVCAGYETETAFSDYHNDRLG